MGSVRPEPQDLFDLALLFWWPLQSLCWSILVIAFVPRCFEKPGDTSHELATWRNGVSESFGMAASIIMAVTLGSTPQLWWIAQMVPSKGFLILPLGEVMLLQCVLTAWAITIFTTSIAPHTRISTLLAYIMFSSTFLGNAIALRLVSGFMSLPYLGGNRIDALSPLMLYLQRFVHDRPVSRLHLMYATSLTIFAVGGAILLAVSFLVVLRRNGRT